MNFEPRNWRLRQAISATRRARLSRARVICNTCGGHVDSVTPDCSRCKDRHRYRARNAQKRRAA